jgi:hypothetical protein
VLSDNFPRFLFSRCRASRTNRNYSRLLNYVKGKNHPISINLRFAVLARSNIFNFALAFIILTNLLFVAYIELLQYD